MSLRDILNKQLSEWMKGTGPESDIVIGSRVRLARNLDGVIFPAVAPVEQLQHVMMRMKDAVESDVELRALHFVPLAEVSQLERVLLVERHLISPQHAENVKHKAVILRDDEAVSVMVNEEDHLRIQTIFPGLQLEEAWQLCNRVDDRLEAHLDYAFAENRGYLTAWPTNVGTGMRSSVMMHLPALTLTQQIPKVVRAVSQFGLVVRGLYGEGTEALGNIYQFSNQVSLGLSEQEILHHLAGIARQVIQQERNARQHLLQRGRWQLEDRVWRAYGTLAHARVMSSNEAMQLLSDVRLGIDLELIDGVDGRILQELLVSIRPAHLQAILGKDTEAHDRDVYRASLIRDRLTRLPGARQP